MNDITTSTEEQCRRRLHGHDVLDFPSFLNSISKAMLRPNEVAIVDDDGAAEVNDTSGSTDNTFNRNGHLPETSLYRAAAKMRPKGFVLPSKSSQINCLDSIPFELNTGVTGVDWSFLQQAQATASIPPSPACPSLATTSTLSSRNSSTRSVRSYDEDCAKQRCFMPECGNTLFPDLKAHMLSHKQRPEKCPVEACDYRIEGSAQPDHMVRHVCTWHFSGTLLCGFCTTPQRSFKRHEVFSQHLANAHGAEIISGTRRRELHSTGTINDPRRPSMDQPIAACNLCSEPFDPQGLYEHLFGCIFRHATEHTSETPARTDSTRSLSRKATTAESNLSSSEEETHDIQAWKRRREQNKAAQRAFKQRKEQHVQELEARLLALEKSSIEISGHNEALREHVESVQSDNERLRRKKMQKQRAEALSALEGLPRSRSANAGPPNAMSGSSTHVPPAASALLPQRQSLRSRALSFYRVQKPESPPMESAEIKLRDCKDQRKLSKHQPLEDSSSGIDEITASSRSLSLTSTSSNGVKSSDEETEWTEEPCPSSPQSDTDAIRVHPMLSPIKHQLVDRIMEDFHRLFDNSPLFRLTQQSAQVTACAGGSSASGPYRGSSSSLSGSSLGNSPAISRKRSLSGGGQRGPGDDGDDGEDPNKRRRSESKSAGKEAIPELRFACPYYKRNPGRHQTFTSCRDPGFNTVARLKEHLYRRHLLPIQCNRCCTTFPNEPSLREHQRDPRGCEVREQVPLEGFDKDQERKLKSKKRSLVFQSEEDKWNVVYRVLFPDDNEADMPSPYIEYQAPGALALSSETSNVARFHEFSRLELPRLVRRTLEVVVEQEAQPLEEKLKDRLVDIVKECQTQLFTMFKGVNGAEDQVITTADEFNLPSSQAQIPDSAPIAETRTFHFHDFDSFLYTPTISSQPTVPSQSTLPTIPETTNSNNPKDISYAEPSSDSPDSGYGSTWTGISSLTQNSNSSLDTSTALYNGNAYVDLNGYYGVFDDEQMLGGDPSFNTSAEYSAWPFIDSAGQAGFGNAHSTSCEVEVGLATQDRS